MQEPVPRKFEGGSMLTIGELSNLGRVSARMLRHYDMIGLLHPAHIGENGYRYYDEAQLSVLSRIETLKEYGFTLSEVGDLLSLPEDELARHIHARRLKAYEELGTLRKILRRMEDDIVRMEGTEIMTDQYHVIVMEAPEQKVFRLRKTINVSETHELFQEMYAEMEKCGLTRAGVTQLVYMGEEFSYENMDVEAQCVVAQDGEGVKTIPAGSFAAVTHIGPYETIRYAYEALGNWLKEHSNAYEVTGNGIERYIVDESSGKEPEDFETGVLFPVRRLK